MDGGFVVCWDSEEQDGSGPGIYGQLFESNGSRRGVEFQVNTYTNSWQNQPSVSSLRDGGFTVCWISDGQDGSGYGIYGQVFDSKGSRWGAEFQVNTYIYNFKWNPSVSSLMDGGLVVCWSSNEQDGSDSGIYGQLFDNEGSRQGTEFQVNTYTNSWPSEPSVSSLMDGGFVVCWQSGVQDGSGYGVYGQLFNSEGSRRGTEFQVNTYTQGSQEDPSVSSLTDGGFVVCWDSYGQDGSGYGIYGKYYLKEINHQLIPFSLLEPAHDSTIKTISPSFKWRQASAMRINLPWELEYYLYLDQEEDFSNPRIFPSIYDTCFTVDSLTPGTTYFWKLLAKNIGGDSLWSSNINGFFVNQEATAINETPVEKATSFKLFGNYPNPFNPETIIKYVLPSDKASYQVKIVIYDNLGQLVLVLKDELQRPGIYTVKWNGQNVAGQAMPSGVYLCVLQAGSFKASQKMLLVR
jgi:hypothetical protein